MSSLKPRTPRKRPSRAAKAVRASAQPSTPEPDRIRQPPGTPGRPLDVEDPGLAAAEILDGLDETAVERSAWPALGAAEQERVRSEAQARLSAYLSRGRARLVLTDNLYSMVSIKRADGVITFRVHHMFGDAPPAVLRALAQYAQRQTREAAAVLRAYIDAHEDRIRRRQTPRPITVDVQGRHYNLQTLFDGLNVRYFAGAIQARITWGPRAKRKPSRESIKLGSYTVEDALIRIHPVLDAGDVPEFFVEWIVYHEMLHEVHDMPVVDGRRVYHTAEFRRAEAQFERYAEAVMWERTHLAKLLDR